ncbi:MAG: ABC transporter ATP-binding protein [Phycisphaerales bacterium]
MSAGGGWALEAEGLRRVYPGGRGREARVALDGVSFRVERGAWCALLGPNGAGKSTLMRILCTLEPAREGRVRVLGADPADDVRAVRERIGVVFQKPAMDGLLSVRENLTLHATLQGVAEPTRAAEETAQALGVADRLPDKLGTLSGGLTRRVDLARALLHSPDLLLLDEPTTGLDHESRMRFLADLEARREATGMTVVLSTHLMDEAERASQVILLNEGRIVGMGEPGALRNALGGAVVRARREAAEAMRGVGLDVSSTPGGVMGVACNGDIEQAVGRLASAGVAFEFGPPTLADVYVSMTGRSLNGEAA